MTLRLTAPLAGTVAAMADVPDQVFADGIVGPGIAIDPSGQESVEAYAPVAGTILKLHPHAFIVLAEQGKGVLVHLGLDTVELEGAGFRLHAAESDTVEQGQLLVTWSPTEIAAGGRSPVCPIVAMDSSPESLTMLAVAGHAISAGDDLFDWA